MRKLLTFLFAALMSVSLWAEQATVVFEANGNRKEVTVELSHTFWCNYGSWDGDLDEIIKELYELPLGGRCVCENPEVSGGNGAVIVGLSSNNQYISIDEAFNGSATVTGRYDRRINYSEVFDNFEGFDYSLTISIYFPEQVIVIPTNTGSASYSQDGITINCDDKGDHRGFLIGSDTYTHIIYPSSGYLRISQIELTPGSDKSNHSYVRANGDAPTSSSESSILFTNVIGNNISLSMNWGSIYISEVKVTLRDADTPADPRILGGDAEFPVSTNVSITCATGSSSTIYYTLDGSDPITSSTKIKYTTAFTITSTTTVKAAAYRDGAWSSVVEKTFTKQVAPDFAGEGTEESPYLIESADDWNLFATRVSEGNTYSGKYFQLTNNIAISTMVGTDVNHAFNGNFDGDGHTITATLNNADCCAPFAYTYGATIKNLHVTGTLTATGTHAGGVVGRNGTASLTLINVSSSMTINANATNSNGGLVGYAINATLSGCAFTGKLLSEKNRRLGGLVGWKSNTADSYLTITDCVFDPEEVTNGNSGSKTFAAYGGGTVTFTNCYYTQAISVDQGKQMHAITAGTGVLVLNTGSATIYNVSGITGYGTGISYDNVLYGGNGDEISLNLSGSSYGYTASTGTLSGDANPYTLTMEDADCEIQAKGEPTGIEAVTGYGLQVTEKVLRDGQLLILRDGKLFNVTGAQVR